MPQRARPWPSPKFGPIREKWPAAQPCVRKRIDVQCRGLVSWTARYMSVPPILPSLRQVEVPGTGRNHFSIGESVSVVASPLSGLTGTVLDVAGGGRYIVTLDSSSPGVYVVIGGDFLERLEQRRA